MMWLNTSLSWKNTIITYYPRFSSTPKTGLEFTKTGVLFLLWPLMNQDNTAKLIVKFTFTTKSIAIVAMTARTCWDVGMSCLQNRSNSLCVVRAGFEWRQLDGRASGSEFEATEQSRQRLRRLRRRRRGAGGRGARILAMKLPILNPARSGKGFALWRHWSSQAAFLIDLTHKGSDSETKMARQQRNTSHEYFHR